MQWLLSHESDMQNEYWTGSGSTTHYSKTSSTWVNKIPTIFGLENPYTSNHTIIAKRTNSITAFLKKPSSDKSRKYFLIGLPSGITDDLGHMEDWRKSLLSSLASASPGFNIKVFNYIDLPGDRQNYKWWG